VERLRRGWRRKDKQKVQASRTGREDKAQMRDKTHKTHENKKANQKRHILA
jgi:hypothetical protein